MNDRIRQLVEKAGTAGDDVFDDLVAALRAEKLPPETLIALLQSPILVVRRAAVHGSRGCTDPALLSILAALAGDAAWQVRRDLADVLADRDWWPFPEVVLSLLRDIDYDVRSRAAVACSLPETEPTLRERLHSDDAWQVRQQIARRLADGSAACLYHLIEQLGRDADGDVQVACAQAAERLLTRHGGYPNEVQRPVYSVLKDALGRCRDHSLTDCPRLCAWLEERVNNDLDLEGLKAFGTVLTLEAEAGRLPRAYELDDAITQLWKILSGSAPRAAVLVGESGVGKSALVYELAHRLLTQSDGPWYILRIAPAEFLAGTLYLGEWETKVKKLVEAIRWPRRVILYVPNVEELATMGTTSKSDANVANALAPYVERGEIVILGESTAEAFRKGLGAVRPLRRLFQSVQMQPTDPEDTRSILQAVALEAGADLSDGVLDRIGELAEFHAGGTSEPGRSVGLLRRVLGAMNPSRPVSERDILQTISTSTGIPVDFLDDATPLDRARVRSFFEARIMGQPEAVDAVVDLVTLIKAGLTDPHKPFGVLLFVGPTGVGKTEMARALAEHLFGDPARLLRLDMSEYATFEGFERLLGVGPTPGILTTAVRERPFSVLLLDEIEKSHLNVFDLCLQIFDAGRLTDSQGRTADFRRTIIILTSNAGARSAQETPVGFGRCAAPAESVTQRELGRIFRPEFLNRLDRIVTFRQLSQETAEQIARRELGRVVERSGISRRRLAVEIDETVVPLLLREGYSPQFGARPLKRTVERLVLLPLARVIAAGEAPPGSVLRLAVRREQIEVEVVAAEPTDAEPTVAPRATPIAERLAQLEALVEQLRERTAALSTRKSLLLERTATADWRDASPAERAALHDEVWRLDGVLTAVDKLGQAVRTQGDAIARARSSPRDLERIDEGLAGLENQARHVGLLVACADPRDLCDAYLTLSLVRSQGKALDGVGTLAKMYQRFAERHGFEVEVLDDRRDGHPVEDVICLSISGAGAYLLLQSESGLHTLSKSRGKGHETDREVVRVDVLATPQDEPATEAIRADTRPLTRVTGRLLKPRTEVRLRHEPTLLTLRAWSDKPKAEAISRLRPVLWARVAAAATPTPTKIIRRYALGPAPLVRDVRTGRGTGRLDAVLDGNLELFLLPSGS